MVGLSYRVAVACVPFLAEAWGRSHDNWGETVKRERSATKHRTLHNSWDVGPEDCRSHRVAGLTFAAAILVARDGM